MSLWPFRSKPQPGTSSVEELGALVKQGGHQIAVELSDIAKAQADMAKSQKQTSERVSRLVAQNAEKDADIRTLSKIVGELKDGLSVTNGMLKKIIENMPHEDRPTPPPHMHFPPPPKLPNIGQ